jgi:hypothetical protein
MLGLPSLLDERVERGQAGASGEICLRVLERSVGRESRKLCPVLRPMRSLLGTEGTRTFVFAFDDIM